MDPSAPKKDQSIAVAREMVSLLEGGQHDQADGLLVELARLRESNAVSSKDRSSIDLQERLHALQLENDLKRIIAQQIPMITEWLRYVITATQQAADRTLTAVEAGTVLTDELSQRAEALDSDWNRFLQRKMDADEFRRLSRDVQSFLGEYRKQQASLRGNLSEALMAQSFQDLTGQAIKLAIQSLEGVESTLGRLLGANTHESEPPRIVTADKQGPIGRLDKAGTGHGAETVQDQDQVDDLLSDLGI